MMIQNDTYTKMVCKQEQSFTGGIRVTVTAMNPPFTYHIDRILNVMVYRLCETGMLEDS